MASRKPGWGSPPVQMAVDHPGHLCDLNGSWIDDSDADVVAATVNADGSSTLCLLKRPMERFAHRLPTARTELHQVAVEFHGDEGVAIQTVWTSSEEDGREEIAHRSIRPRMRQLARDAETGSCDGCRKSPCGRVVRGDLHLSSPFPSSMVESVCPVSPQVRFVGHTTGRAVATVGQRALVPKPYPEASTIPFRFLSTSRPCGLSSAHLPRALVREANRSSSRSTANQGRCRIGGARDSNEKSAARSACSVCVCWPCPMVQERRCIRCRSLQRLVGSMGQPGRQGKDEWPRVVHPAAIPRPRATHCALQGPRSRRKPVGRCSPPLDEALTPHALDLLRCRKTLALGKLDDHQARRVNIGHDNGCAPWSDPENARLRSTGGRGHAGLHARQRRATHWRTASRWH